MGPGRSRSRRAWPELRRRHPPAAAGVGPRDAGPALRIRAGGRRQSIAHPQLSSRKRRSAPPLQLLLEQARPSILRFSSAPREISADPGRAETPRRPSHRLPILPRSAPGPCLVFLMPASRRLLARSRRPGHRAVAQPARGRRGADSRREPHHTIRSPRCPTRSPPSPEATTAPRPALPLQQPRTHPSDSCSIRRRRLRNVESRTGDRRSPILHPPSSGKRDMGRADDGQRPVEGVHELLLGEM